jgi:DNA-binding NarL/FixJ family response regulator
VTASADGQGAAAHRSTVSDGSASDSPGPARPIRVLLADDHPVVRAGLRGMLATEPDIEVVAEAASGPEAVAVARRTTVDVVLMDLRMPDGDGVTATAAIAALALPSAAAGAAAPDVSSPAAPRVPRVLVLTTYDEDADILRAVEAGATGYLLKDATKRELADAIRAAARGETVLAPAVAGRLITRLRRPPALDRPQLSARETEILIRAARGMTNAEIGRDLFIGEATVKTHLLRASTKLGVSGRTAAVAAATERGLLRRPAG